MNSLQQIEENMRQRQDQMINRKYCFVVKDEKGRVVKVDVCEPIQESIIAELKQQAFINKAELDKAKREQELEEHKAAELKERKLARVRVLCAYNLYFMDSIEIGDDPAMSSEIERLEEWFKKYRKHETDEVIESPLLEKYLKEVDL